MFKILPFSGLFQLVNYGCFVSFTGESIHAMMNDIERKCWVIKNEEARLWKLIERYELRNVTNVDIVVPMRRVFKNGRS